MLVFSLLLLFRGKQQADCSKASYWLSRLSRAAGGLSQLELARAALSKLAGWLSWLK